MRHNALTAEDYYNRAYERPDSDLDGQIADYTEAIRLDPDYADAYHERGAVRYMQDDFDGAIQDQTEALRLKPDNVDAYAIRGYAHEAAGNYESAIQDYNE